MHILEIPSFFPPHGGQFCLEQAKALRDIGHEVRVLSVLELALSVDHAFYLTAPWREHAFEMEGIPVFQSYMRAYPKAVHCNISRWICRCQKAADRYVQHFGRPDVLHAHCCKSAGIAAREIGRRLGVPYYITEHLSRGLFERDFGPGWQRHRWLLAILRQAYEEAACVLPVSRELTDELAPFFGRSYTCRPLSNIVDTSFFTYHDRDCISSSRRPFRFCCLAIADIRGKGYDVLAEAVRQLPEDVELHVAGRGTDSAPMRNLFAKSRNVHLLGQLDKTGVRDLLWQSDALVLPSRSEAQPLVLLEALATGIPVVATECVSPSVRLSLGSLFAPVGDARGLAQKMREVMNISPSREFSDQVQSIASPQVVASQLTEIFSHNLSR